MDDRFMRTCFQKNMSILTWILLNSAFNTCNGPESNKQERTESEEEGEKKPGI